MVLEESNKPTFLPSEHLNNDFVRPVKLAEMKINEDLVFLAEKNANQEKQIKSLLKIQEKLMFEIDRLRKQSSSFKKTIKSLNTPAEDDENLFYNFFESIEDGEGPIDDVEGAGKTQMKRFWRRGVFGYMVKPKVRRSRKQ